jgi:glycosyltransferase involved in cell wall biosynthesis
VMEAMAAGVPVVAARSGGIPEMIEHEVSGLLVTPGRADELAAAIVRTLTEPALTETMTRTARAACRARFTMTRFAADVLDLYDRILAAAEPRTASVVTA